MLGDVMTKPKAMKTFHKMMNAIMNSFSRARSRWNKSMEKRSGLIEVQQDDNEVMTTRVRCDL
jgi:hypothetical protein